MVMKGNQELDVHVEFRLFDFSYRTNIENPCRKSAEDHELLQAVLVLFHHQEECIPPLPNVQSGTGTDQEGNQLSMGVNSTATKTATLKLKKKCFGA